MLRRNVGTLVACFVALATPLAAQTAGQDPEIVDRVAAIVGDSTVLFSQVREEMERMRAQSPSTYPTTAAAEQGLFQEVLDTWVNRMIVLQAAVKDTLIRVEAERVDEIVNQEIEDRTKAFQGGQPAFQAALLREGITLAEYREIMRTQVRQEQLQQMFMQRQLQDAAPIEVSETEMRTAFDQAAGQLQQRPRLVTLEQVVLAPSPSDAAKADARATAQSLLDSVRAGADFEALAMAHSMDPGSAETGGDLGWFRRGAMVREFEDAAFDLIDGQVSGLVETEFGFHIIKVERSRAGERKGRHILIRAEVGPNDLARTKALGDSIVTRARAGTSMSSLYADYSDPLAPDTLTVSFEQLDQLPPAYAAIRTAAKGDVVGPLEYDTGRDESRVAIVRVREIREAGAYAFEDVKAQLAQQLQRTKQIERLLKDLRAKTHIEIRM